MLGRSEQVLGRPETSFAFTLLSMLGLSSNSCFKMICACESKYLMISFSTKYKLNLESQSLNVHVLFSRILWSLLCRDMCCCIYKIEYALMFSNPCCANNKSNARVRDCSEKPTVPRVSAYGA